MIKTLSCTGMKKMKVIFLAKERKHIPTYSETKQGKWQQECYKLSTLSVSLYWAVATPLNFFPKSILSNLCSMELGFPACFNEQQMLNVDGKLFYKTFCLNDKLWNRLSRIISLEEKSSMVRFEKKSPRSFARKQVNNLCHWSSQ